VALFLACRLLPPTALFNRPLLKVEACSLSASSDARVDASRAALGSVFASSSGMLPLGDPELGWFGLALDEELSSRAAKVRKALVVAGHLGPTLNLDIVLLVALDKTVILRARAPIACIRNG
jgi:hypothetical protein